jgi:hypothetical protein
MNFLKAGLLIGGVASIVIGIGLCSVPCALVVGGALLLGMLYLISIAETRVVKK